MSLRFVPVLAAALLAPQNAPKIDQARIDAAITRGVEWLKGTSRFGGGKHGTRELALLALVHAGVRPSDPVFAGLLQEMLEEELQTTYRVSLQAMVLEELDRVKYQKRIWQCAQFLVDNQCDNGQWSYGQPTTYGEPSIPGSNDVATGTLFPPGKVVIFGDPEPGQKPPVRQKVAVKKRREGGRGHGDNSNSQYALLGLRACHDAGIVLPKDVVQKSAQGWRQSQSGDDFAKGGMSTGGGPTAPPRGWSYHGRGGAYGSMTAGSVGALTICDYILGIDWKKDENVNAGLSWLRDHFTVSENPKRNGAHHYYYLYGLERAGMLYGIEKLGRHEWYAEGAHYLVQNQRADGAWGSPVDTCFAILFLRRATRPLVESRDSKK
jgi:hypothetical protein